MSAVPFLPPTLPKLPKLPVNLNACADMKLLSISIALLFSSCGTYVYRDGKPILAIGGDAENVQFTSTADGDTTLTIGSLSRSQPINAVGSVVKTGVAALSTAAALKSAPNIVNAWTGNHPVP